MSYSQRKSLMDCWVDAYEDFSFRNELLDFERVLLQQGIIKSTELKTYNELFETFSDSTTSDIFINIRTERYVTPKPFQQCTYQYDASERDSTDRKFGFLFSIYHIQSKNHAKIYLEVQEGNRLLVNDKEVILDDLSRTLVGAIDKLFFVPTDEVILEIKASPNTKMGFIVSVQQKIKESQIRIVNYLTF